MPEVRESTQQKLVEAVKRWLATHREWLLIFDNVEDLSLLKAYLPAARQGAVLLTTRLHALEGLAQPLELSAFSRAEALHFLLSRARLVDAAQPLDEVPHEVLRVATALVKAMGGLPLALDQAGAYIDRTRCSLSDYLRLYQRHQGRLLAERSRASDHPHSVKETFLLSFEQLAQNSAAAGDLLRLCALLHPDAIPEELLREGAAQWTPVLREAVSDPLTFDQTLAELLRFSLVKRSPEQRTLSLHRLVQAVLLETIAGAEREQWLARAIAALDTLFPEGGKHESWSRCERLLPHALLCVQRAEASQEELVLASVAFKAAEYLYERGRYGEAEPLFLRALRTREQRVGPADAEVAAVLYRLADLYRDQGKYAEAESRFLRALHILERQLGPEHPNVANSLNGLANLYREQGRYAESEPLCLRALRSCEQQLGPEHPDLVLLLNNLANFYLAQERYAEAEPLYLRALHILEQQLGPEHPRVALLLIGLADLYQEQERYAQAEPLYLRALAIREHASELHHFQTADILYGLATLQEKQGILQEAASLYQRAIAIREEVYGPQHPKSTETRERLRAVLGALGRDQEAAGLDLVQPESAET